PTISSPRKPRGASPGCSTSAGPAPPPLPRRITPHEPAPRRRRRRRPSLPDHDRARPGRRRRAARRHAARWRRLRRQRRRGRPAVPAARARRPGGGAPGAAHRPLDHARGRRLQDAGHVRPGDQRDRQRRHAPRAVLSDTATLRSLPARELRAGLAEVVKYGAIVDAPFLDWLDARADALLAGDDAALAEAIARSCAHKAAIVERDPYEHGDRALLNFGHTFGHAIETAQGYGGLIHGEAVAVGMVQAARLSERLGLSSAADTARLRGLLRRFGLPVEPPPGLDPDTLLAHMRLDKKAQSGGLRFIVWDGAGRARV